MIDEELYQQAADELNSDRRRAHIWARACALSKDDHDEARYLYTNLRVEELIAERDSGSGSTVDDTNAEDLNATLAMELDAAGDLPSSMDYASESVASPRVVPLDETADYDIDSTISMDEYSLLSSDSDLQLDDDPLLENIELPKINDSSAPLSPMEREYYEKHPEQLKELEEQSDEDLDVILTGIDNSDYANDDTSSVLTADFSDATSTQAVYVEDDMEWLENEEPTHSTQNNLQRITPQAHAHDETDRFTQDLLRQVDDLPGQHSDVVASEDSASEESTWEPSPRANMAAVGTAAAIGAARYGEASETNQANRPRHSSGSTGLPIDLTEGKSGTEYTIFQRDQNVQAVKKGVSWSALFFTVPFLIYRHMFATAIVYTIMGLIVAAGLIFMGLNWIDAGDSATDLVKLATVGFGLLAVVGLLYLPFRHGNSWRSEKLERRGFELVARVKAGNPGKAVALARRASALD
jgi:hypothetical protein